MKAQWDNSILFRGLSKEQIDVLVKKGQRLFALAGQTLFQEGDEANEMYILLEGEAGVYRKGQHDREMQIASISSGSVFGELGMLSPGRVRTASVRTETDCSLLILPADLYKLWTRYGDDLAFPFLRNVAWLLAEIVYEQEWRRAWSKPEGPDPEALSKQGTRAIHGIGEILGPERSKKLCQHLNTKQCKAGEFIFRKDEPAEQMYMLAKGKVQILFERVQNKNVAIASASPGWLLGELSFLAQRTRSNSALASTDVTMHELTDKKWEVLTKAAPDVARSFIVAVLRYLVEYIKYLDDIIMEETSGAAE